MERKVVEAERRCIEVHKAIDSANEYDQHDLNVREGAEHRGGTQEAVLTVFESPGHSQHAHRPLIVDDVPVGHAGCTPGIQHVATAAADSNGPPELEGEFIDFSQQFVDLECVWPMARDAEETHQYRDLPLNDIPVGFPPAQGRDDTIMEFLNLEVRPAAFRGGMRDAKGLSSDGTMDLEGMSEDAQQCLRHKNDAHDRLVQPYLPAITNLTRLLLVKHTASESNCVHFEGECWNYKEYASLRISLI